MVDFHAIYASPAGAVQYDRLVSREDWLGNIPAALRRICPLDGIDVVEFGAGTGRLSRLLAPLVRSLLITDRSPAMLGVAVERFQALGLHNWRAAVADNRRMPVASGCADLAVAGWSFGHFTGWHPTTWRDEIGRAVMEMMRVLRPGGTAVILETLGTGRETPLPPTHDLAAYYAFLEHEHGFAVDWIRTDYRFETLVEAETLTRFFFGDALAAWVAAEKRLTLPECTGVWQRAG